MAALVLGECKLIVQISMYLQALLYSVNYISIKRTLGHTPLINHVCMLYMYVLDLAVAGTYIIVNLGLRMYQNASQSINFSKFSGGACPRTPLVSGMLRMHARHTPTCSWCGRITEEKLPPALNRQSVVYFTRVGIIATDSALRICEQ